jgi:hypothetical protein
MGQDQHVKTDEEMKVGFYGGVNCSFIRSEI